MSRIIAYNVVRHNTAFRQVLDSNLTTIRISLGKTLMFRGFPTSIHEREWVLRFSPIHQGNRIISPLHLRR